MFTVKLIIRSSHLIILVDVIIGRVGSNIIMKKKSIILVDLIEGKKN